MTIDPIAHIDRFAFFEFSGNFGRAGGYQHCKRDLNARSCGLHLGDRKLDGVFAGEDDFVWLVVDHL